MGKSLKGKELGKGLRQRKDGYYEGRYVGRFGKLKFVYGRDLGDVRKKLSVAQAKTIEKRDVMKEIVLDRWFDIWMDVYKRGAVKPNILVNYEMMYRVHIKDVLGNKKLTEITKSMVQMLINDLYKAGQGYEQQNKARILLLDLFNRAIEDDYLVKNPARGGKGKK